MNLQTLYDANIKLLKSLNINFRECTHEPVLSYEAAAKVRQKFGLTGVESKNLFLKAKGGGYFMLVTIEGKRADFEKLKELLGSKVSVAGQEELKEKTGCEPYCAIPFGFGKEIGIIVDSGIFMHEKFIYSLGPPEKTIEIETKDINKILGALVNKIIRI
ncbi:MAG: YbaK/EbsC family protein [Candidatus Diapherotrites archaeon]